jgi:hypothetical protein
VAALFSLINREEAAREEAAREEAATIRKAPRSARMEPRSCAARIPSRKLLGTIEYAYVQVGDAG